MPKKKIVLFSLLKITAFNILLMCEISNIRIRIFFVLKNMVSRKFFVHLT